ncbi:MAG: YihY/virulence factor BrkB family protein [Anaerolineae bacterium]|jgi:membrane protein|nr:YihY/virulence factor BrkB family protein [Anaerolineae bacterium]
MTGVNWRAFLLQLHAGIRGYLRRWSPYFQRVVNFILEIVNRFGRHHMQMYAAALSFYTLLSIVPLLLSVLAVGSLFIDAADVQSIALKSLEALLPATVEPVRLNIENILRYRGSVGAISLLSTLWSASGIFTTLELAINAVWERPHRRTYWKRRLIGILSLMGVVAWVVGAFILQTLWRLLPQWFPVINHINFPISKWGERGLSFLVILLFNLLTYRFFPARPVRRRVAWLVGLGVSLAWVGMRDIFAWALSTGLLNYPLVYGSLWVMILPTVWAYWSYLVLLLGAELQAYLDERYFVELQEEYQRSALKVTA